MFVCSNFYRFRFIDEKLDLQRSGVVILSGKFLNFLIFGYFALKLACF
jgi:hypothetical protein